MDNHIIDRRTLDEMAALFEENDVLGDDGRSIEFEKLRKKARASCWWCVREDWTR